MKTVLLLAPGMDGPQGHPYNASWPADLDRMVERHRWKVVTPSLLLLAAIAEQEGFEATVVDEDFAPAQTDKTFDLVCMYTVTPNAKRAYRYAEAYRLRGSWVVRKSPKPPWRQQENCGGKNLEENSLDK